MENNSVVLENVFKDLLLSSDAIFIVAHNRPDFDAIGASIGCFIIANKYKKDCYVIVDDDIETLDGAIGTKSVIEDISNEGRIKNHTHINVIKSSDIEKYKGNNNLLVVLDANDKCRICVDPENEVFTNVIVVDHHKLSSTPINTKYKYVNPHKSSTCEIIAQVIGKLNIKIPDEKYADYMLAGISLDTDRYKDNVSDNTFEVIARLIRNGASNTRVSKMFVELDFERGMARKKLIAENTEKLSFNFQIAITADESNNLYFLPEDIAKVAKSLQEYGFNASFAMGHISSNVVSVSARSDGSIDVGKIMNNLDGGGSETSAATKVTQYSIPEIKEKLKSVLTPYFFVTEQDEELRKSKKLELTL